MTCQAGERARIAQLEPHGLVEAFLAHPPEGFTPWVSANCAGFIAPYDLRTTLDPRWSSFITGLPLARFIERALRWRVNFVGCTTTEYLTFDASTNAAALVDAVCAESPPAARMIVFKDIARDSPLLDGNENMACAQLCAALSGRGFTLLQGLPLAWADVEVSEDAYLARLSSGRRRDIRRKLRSREHIRVETVATGDARFDDPACLDEFHALYEAVHAQSEVHFDRLSPAFFAALLRDGKSGGRVFIYRRDGLLIGWNLCYAWRGALVDKYIGFSYPQARENNLYCVSWMHALEHARRHGLHRYIAGWTDQRAKRDLGARFTYTWNAVRPKSRILRGLLKIASRHFESAPP